MTSARAVTTSLRPRRPSEPIPRAASSENTASPASGLTPSRLAPAAPANAPLGMACAGNAEPRSTTKNPTTPATTATIVATIEVFIMNPANMPAPSSAGARAVAAIWSSAGRAGHRCGHGAAPGRPPRDRQAGDQVGGEDRGDDEEADRQALVARSPVVAVVGQEDAEPRGSHADHARHGQRPGHRCGEAQRGGGGTDQQGGRKYGADRHGRQPDRDGQGQHEEQADHTDGDAARRGDVGAHRGEQQRAPDDRDAGDRYHAEDHDGWEGAGGGGEEHAGPG